MTDTAPAVALLFDDTELGAQLRDALDAHGARIVHEGGVDSLDRQRLRAVGADVIVINLDDTAQDVLERVYALIDGDRPRVVFNDAQASRALAGWDRDRWARHLAVKVLRAGELDPPRPVDARAIETAHAGVTAQVNAQRADATPADATQTVQQQADTMQTDQAQDQDADTDLPDAVIVPAQWPAESLATTSGRAAADAALDHVQRTHSESESLAAELEVLLASAELAAADAGGESGTGWLPDAGEPPPPPSWLDAERPPVGATYPSAAAGESIELDDVATGIPLDLLPADAEFFSDLSTPASPSAVAVSAPTDWALLDDDAPASAILPPDRNDPMTFGVEKLSAADYLAPSAEQVARSFESTLNLQLESMTEAIAPEAISIIHEMHLDELHMALSRLVLTGAGSAGADAANAFFAALPGDLRMTFVHAQHLRNGDGVVLVDELAGSCALPVRLATDGSFARLGEVLVVPPTQRVRVHRDSRVELRPATRAAQEPSIDDSFVMAAEGFGHEALAIVFAGHGADALAGAQAIHDCGGQVWVESAAGGQGDAISATDAGPLVDFSGTPQELAARLLEVFG